MLQYDFNESYTDIFELNFAPCLSYLQKITSFSEELAEFHRHQNVGEILFVEHGINHCTIDNNSYRLKKGDLVLINSDVLHNTLEDDNNTVAYIIGIKNLQIKNMEKNKLVDAEQTPVISTLKIFPKIAYCFSLFEELTLLNAKRNINTSSSNNYILCALLAIIYNINQKEKASHQKDDYNLGVYIKEYIDEHYLDEINLKSMAQNLHISEYYLSHTFKKYIGYSPMQYVIQQRIKEAQNLLLSTDLTITEIAFHCGYNNSNYFQSVFNNIVGMPPGKYRKSWKGI